MILNIGKYLNVEKYLVGISPIRPYISLFISSLLSALLVVGLILPQVKTTSSLRGKRTLAAERIGRISSKATKLADLLSRREVLESGLVLVDNALPSEENVPEMIGQIQQIASESGVILKGLYFGLKAKEEAPPTQLLKTYLQVEVWGPYSNLKTFLQSLENASRIIIAETLKFDLVETKEGGEALKATATLVSFYASPLKDLVLDAPVTLDLSSPKVVNSIEKIKKLRTYKLKMEPPEIGKLNPFED